VIRKLICFFFKHKCLAVNCENRGWGMQCIRCSKFMPLEPKPYNNYYKDGWYYL